MDNGKIKISPKEFLKFRRPEQFSDSATREKGKLSRAVLEHQLSNLNKQSKELAFEEFAKRLCEKVICPNLLAQTGPVAGGDGKVDTQTFPVSEQNKLLWFDGTNEAAHSERWAFAVSTQSKWKEKCEKDVKKIFNTGRGYTKAFFVTNQYAKANQRSSLEDRLTEETGIDVRILDISWLIDEMIKGGYEQIAIETLSIEVDWSRERVLGANDYAKVKQLDELCQKIKEEVNPSHVEHHQIDWFLDVAVLQKELEYPAAETQGLFDRAVRVAKRFGNATQLFAAHYQYAWAAYFWFEDIALFQEQFELALKVLSNCQQMSLWRKLMNLFALYAGEHRREPTEGLYLDIDELKSTIRSALSELGEDEARPSNSLLARSSLVFLELFTVQSTDEADRYFAELEVIFSGAERLVGFPFEELVEMLGAVDQIFCGLGAYESLMDYLSDQSAERQGAIAGATRWLERGIRRLETRKPYEAIRFLGKSLAGLYKDESKRELIAALNLLGSTYEHVGLLWAARANYLLSASIVTDNFHKYGDLIPAQVHSYYRMTKIEMQIGRVDHALHWWALCRLVHHSIQQDVLSENDVYALDGYLAQCFLNADLGTLEPLSILPDQLDGLELQVGRGALLYALGHEQQFSEEYEQPLEVSPPEFLTILRDTDLGVAFATPTLCLTRYTSINCTVTGCKISVAFTYRSPIVELAETLLSSIQALLATSFVDKLTPVEHELLIEITADDQADINIQHEFDDRQAVLKANVLCSAFSSSELNVDGQQLIQQWLHRFLVEVYCRMMHTNNLEAETKSLFGNDKGLERAVSFGSCFVTQQNILGEDWVRSIQQQTNNPDFKQYPLIRDEPWDTVSPKPAGRVTTFATASPGAGAPPRSLMDAEAISHPEIKLSGLITPRLWDRATWVGTAFAEGPTVPGLWLVFKDEAAAQCLFEKLLSDVGPDDGANRIRLSIVRGIDRDNSNHYRVAITENASLDEGSTAIVAARVNTMTPSSSANLARFLDAYKEWGAFELSYCVESASGPVAPSERSAILLTHLNVVDAWEVGPNDPERMAIRANDRPVVPVGVLNPPVDQILNRRRT